MIALETEALSLPSGERAKLAADLLESLENLTPQELTFMWEREALRRAEQVDNGEVSLVSSEIVKARTLELLR